MSKAQENLNSALQRAMAIRPQVGGFPYLAESLRQAGVSRNVWTLPSAQSLYFTDLGAVVSPGSSLISAPTDVPPFDQDALIRALRIDQVGQSTFPEFLTSCWQAGVVRFDVDFLDRLVTYHGCLDEKYVENYPAVQI